MKIMRMLLAIVALTGLTGCSFIQSLALKHPAPEQVVIEPEEIVAAPMFTVTTLNVDVPRTLVVSESSRYYPNTDIVWRGDPIGDRYQQIEKIFKTGMGKGVAQSNGPKNVIVDIVVKRFHSVTERTRYTVGGVHSIRFNMTVRDAKSGKVIEPTRLVKADLKAFGGRVALRAESVGLTQKVRVTEHLEQVILYELTRPRDFLEE